MTAAHIAAVTLATIAAERLPRSLTVADAANALFAQGHARATIAAVVGQLAVASLPAFDASGRPMD